MDWMREANPGDHVTMVAPDGTKTHLTVEGKGREGELWTDNGVLWKNDGTPGWAHDLSVLPLAATLIPYAPDPEPPAVEFDDSNLEGLIAHIEYILTTTPDYDAATALEDLQPLVAKLADRARKGEGHRKAQADLMWIHYPDDMGR